MTHSKECMDNFDAWQKEMDAYNEQWENHCGECSGWGGRYYSYDPSPAGVGLSPGSFTDFDTCPHCIDLGHCPRCSAAWNPLQPNPLEDDEAACPNCGWTVNTPGAPESPECFCYEEHLWDDQEAKEYFAKNQEPYTGEVED